MKSINGLPDSVDLKSAVSLGTGVIAMDTSDKSNYFFRCHTDNYTNLDLTCDASSKSPVNISTDSSLASQSRTLDSVTFFFTTNPATSTSTFYLDNGQTSLISVDVQDSLDANKLVLFRDNTGMFYGLVVNINQDTIYGFSYDPIALSISALDPINAATFGLANDLCIKSISSNSDPNFLEIAALNRCDSD